MTTTTITRTLSRAFGRNPDRLVPVAHVSGAQLQQVQGDLADAGIAPLVIGRSPSFSPYPATPRFRVLVPATQAESAKAMLAGV